MTLQTNYYTPKDNDINCIHGIIIRIISKYSSPLSLLNSEYMLKNNISSMFKTLTTTQPHTMTLELPKSLCKHIADKDIPNFKNDMQEFINRRLKLPYKIMIQIKIK